MRIRTLANLAASALQQAKFHRHSSMEPFYMGQFSGFKISAKYLAWALKD